METSTTQDLPGPSENLDSLGLDENSATEFYENIPSLNSISSYAVAIESWRRFMRNENPHRSVYLDPHGNIYDFCFLNQKDETKAKEILHELPLPHFILEMVENYLNLVRREINEWTRDDGYSVVVGESITISHLIFLQWLPNGKIDRRKTASNMLSNRRMTPAEKFEILCNYCFVDEIKKFPKDSLPKDYIEDNTWYRNPVAYYWLQYLDNELENFPIEFRKCLESSITTARYSTWSAIEYFLDLLNDEERESKIEEILKRGFRFQKNLFSKISKSQILRLISEMPVEIMENFWMQRGHERFVVQIWIYIRNSIDEVKFIRMKYMLNDHTSSYNHEKARCLVDIWNHCPDHMKEVAFVPFISRNIGDFCIDNFRNRRFDGIEFIAPYLSYASSEYRKDFMFRQLETIVVCIDPSVIDQLIKLCLPDASHGLQFKKDVLESTSTKMNLFETFEYTNFERVNKFLKYYCPDSNTRSKFCDEMLQDWDGEINSRIKADWINAFEFLDKNLLPECALKYKKKVATKFADVCSEVWSNDEKTSKIMEIVSQVLDAEELGSFKRGALEKVRENYNWGKFDQNIIDGFLSWCCDDDGHKVAEFKKKLSMNDIFERVWNSMKFHCFFDANCEVNEETLYEEFEPLDKCLQWYFENDEEVKRFKLEKQPEYCGGENSGFMEHLSESDGVLMGSVLARFFQDDVEGVARKRRRTQVSVE